MLHIITVHWQDAGWVDIQLDYLHKNIQYPFKIYAFLNNLPEKHRAKYFYSSTEPIKEHAIKLNLLADIAAFNTIDENDLLMFLDGDAFPIGDIISFGQEKLKQYPLIAVQRLENLGDIQPHPCFCLTTIKFWKEICGDWKAGSWKNSNGKIAYAEGRLSPQYDVGGKLLNILEEKGYDWYPLRRSNKRNLHPVLFGLYDDLIYHHGAAFRKPITRRDLAVTTTKAKLIEFMPMLSLKKMLSPQKKIIEEKNNVLSQQVLEMIKNNSNFYKYFQEMA